MFLFKVKDNIVFNLCLVISFNKELSILNPSLDLILVQLSINNLLTPKDCLYHQKLAIWIIFNPLNLILLYSHIKGKFLLEEIFLDEESCWGERSLLEISIFFQFTHDIIFEQFILIEDVEFPFLAVQVIVVIALSTNGLLALLAWDIQKACLWDGKKVFAA